MDASAAVDLAHRALLLVLLLSLPAVLVAAAVGLAVAIVQAATQIQDQTVGQALRLLVIIAVVLLTSTWAAGQIYNFADRALDAVGLRGSRAR